MRDPWSETTFSGAVFGNAKLTNRCMSMASELARHPMGTVTGTFASSAEREGAYRFLNNGAVSSRALLDAAGEATARECAKEERVFVVVDQSSLLLEDRKCVRDIGRVGNWSSRGRGVLVSSALAVDEKGTPVGLLDQQYWVREERSNGKRGRPVEATEMRYTVNQMQCVQDHVAEHAPDTEIVFVVDRGYDTRWLLEQVDEGVEVVMRATHDRRLKDVCDEREYLNKTLENSPVRGVALLHLPKTKKRCARDCRVSIQASQVTIRRRNGENFQGFTTLNAVLVEELNARLAPVRWLLLTTLPIDTQDNMMDIVRAYTFRWRIEEFHRAWKKGGGHVEDNQLRSREGIVKWSILHAVVAARALKLTYLARTQPDVLATEHFSKVEIEATSLLIQDVLGKKAPPVPLKQTPRLHEVVMWIALIGGYTGLKSSGGPPGKVVIGRGLLRVIAAAQGITALRRSGSPE